MRIAARLRRACDKHDQILRGCARLLADFCRCLWKAFFNTFKIFEQLCAPPLELKSGLMSSRSFLESSPTFGVRIAIIGNSPFRRKRRQVLRRKAVAHIRKRRAGADLACRCQTGEWHRRNPSAEMES